jgi:hypothetical protein
MAEKNEPVYFPHNRSPMAHVRQLCYALSDRIDRLDMDLHTFFNRSPLAFPRDYIAKEGQIRLLDYYLHTIPCNDPSLPLLTFVGNEIAQRVPTVINRKTSHEATNDDDDYGDDNTERSYNRQLKMYKNSMEQVVHDTSQAAEYFAGQYGNPAMSPEQIIPIVTKILHSFYVVPQYSPLNESEEEEEEEKGEKEAAPDTILKLQTAQSTPELSSIALENLSVLGAAALTLYKAMEHLGTDQGEKNQTLSCLRECTNKITANLFNILIQIAGNAMAVTESGSGSGQVEKRQRFKGGEIIGGGGSRDEQKSASFSHYSPLSNPPSVIRKRGRFQCHTNPLNFLAQVTTQISRSVSNLISETSSSSSSSFSFSPASIGPSASGVLTCQEHLRIEGISKDKKGIEGRSYCIPVRPERPINSIEYERIQTFYSVLNVLVRLLPWREYIKEIQKKITWDTDTGELVHLVVDAAPHELEEGSKEVATDSIPAFVDVPPEIPRLMNNNVTKPSQAFQWFLHQITGFVHVSFSNISNMLEYAKSNKETVRQSSSASLSYDRNQLLSLQSICQKQQSNQYHQGETDIDRKEHLEHDPFLGVYAAIQPVHGSSRTSSPPSSSSLISSADVEWSLSKCISVFVDKSDIQKFTPTAKQIQMWNFLERHHVSSSLPLSGFYSRSGPSQTQFAFCQGKPSGWAFLSKILRRLFGLQPDSDEKEGDEQKRMTIVHYPHYLAMSISYNELIHLEEAYLQCPSRLTFEKNVNTSVVYGLRSVTARDGTTFFRPDPSKETAIDYAPYGDPRVWPMEDDLATLPCCANLVIYERMAF